MLKKSCVCDCWWRGECKYNIIVSDLRKHLKVFCLSINNKCDVLGIMYDV